MGVSTRGGLVRFMARLHQPSEMETDAALLARFVNLADESAFAGLVRRHGPIVWSVCLRRLGQQADAEDAFQAVFLALAKSARGIQRGETLPGWLYRVAYLISLKAAGKRARHPVASLPQGEIPMPDSSRPAWECDELRAVVDHEVARLPDKLRAVVVLCLIEGRTNTEAAGILAIPTGTVDSRLNAARKQLQAALTRRGVACGAAVGLEQLLGAPLAATEAVHDLVSRTIQAVLADTLAPAVRELAQGVLLVTSTKMRFLAGLGIILGLLGGAGAGIMMALGEEKPKQTSVEKKDIGAANPPPTTSTKGVPPAKTRPAGEPVKELSELVGKGVKPDGASIGDIFQHIEDSTDLVIRVDVAAFRRLGVVGTAMGDAVGTSTAQFLANVYSSKISLPRRVDRISLEDMLSDALAQVESPWPCTYQLRGSQIVIVPAYSPPVRPGLDPLAANTTNLDIDTPVLPQREMNEQIYGGVVRVSASKMPLVDVLADLRKQTGANIVLDPRCSTGDKKEPLTITLNDVRLYDALRVVADMAQLKLVYAGNIYYITTPANAREFQPAPPPAPASQSQLFFPPLVPAAPAPAPPKPEKK
jgi:RNA polymerase sigma factor (sigma-70 family)